MEWKSADNVKLISLFKEHEVLWKTDHKDYGKRGPCFKALKKVSTEMGGRGNFEHYGSTVAY